MRLHPPAASAAERQRGHGQCVPPRRSRDANTCRTHIAVSFCMQKPSSVTHQPARMQTCDMMFWPVSGQFPGECAPSRSSITALLIPVPPATKVPGPAHVTDIMPKHDDGLPDQARSTTGPNGRARPRASKTKDGESGTRVVTHAGIYNDPRLLNPSHALPPVAIPTIAARASYPGAAALVSHRLPRR